MNINCYIVFISKYTKVYVIKNKIYARMKIENENNRIFYFTIL